MTAPMWMAQPRVRNDGRPGFRVTANVPGMYVIARLPTQAAADEFVRAIERATRDDARDGRVAGGYP